MGFINKFNDGSRSLWGDKERYIGFYVWKLFITTRIRSKKCIMGRFGGGWNWKLGVCFGTKKVIVDAFITEITIEWNPDKGRQTWLTS